MEERRYQFIFNNNSGAPKQSPIARSSGNESNNAKKGLIQSEEGRIAFAKGMAAYGVVKTFATQVVNHEVSMVKLRTGSNELQERANFINSVAQKGLNILETTAAGAALGGLPGAALGFVLGAAHTVIGFAQNQERINTERSVENVGLMMMNIRAGANGSRHL